MRQAMEELQGQRRGHGGFYVQEVVTEEGRQQVLRLVRATDQEVAAFQAAEKMRYVDSVHAAAGTANCQTDIC
jgi:hypothetical protein